MAAVELKEKLVWVSNHIELNKEEYKDESQQSNHSNSNDSHSAESKQSNGSKQSPNLLINRAETILQIDTDVYGEKVIGALKERPGSPQKTMKLTKNGNKVCGVILTSICLVFFIEVLAVIFQLIKDPKPNAKADTVRTFRRVFTVIALLIAEITVTCAFVGLFTSVKEIRDKTNEMNWDQGNCVAKIVSKALRCVDMAEICCTCCHNNCSLVIVGLIGALLGVVLFFNAVCSISEIEDTPSCTKVQIATDISMVIIGLIDMIIFGLIISTNIFSSDKLTKPVSGLNILQNYQDKDPGDKTLLTRRVKDKETRQNEKILAAHAPKL